jgi:hypothetical protein
MDSTVEYYVMQNKLDLEKQASHVFTHVWHPEEKKEDMKVEGDQ